MSAAASATPTRATPCHIEGVDIGRHSNCPSDTWHDRVAPLLVVGSGDVVMLNIGANKGYNLAEWMQRYTAADISHKKWHQLMMHSASPPCALQCCGVCLICHRARIQQRADAGARLRLHAFELQPSNERLLRQLVALTDAPVEVHGEAVSNVTGTVFTRDSGAPGYESVAASRRAVRNGLVRNVTTVDAFMATRRIERLSFVSVDTEGWDGFVLRGMRGALERKAVDVFEFEYMRAWKQHLGATGLADTLRWLDGIGYTCFWQGNRGALAQASGGCWVDEFQTRISHRWSNLVCAHRPDLLDTLRSTTSSAKRR